MVKHLLLIGLNYQHRRWIGDKNFWFELVPLLARRLARITILSIRKEDKTREEYSVDGCKVAVHYMSPHILGNFDTKRSGLWRQGAFPSRLGMIDKRITAARISRAMASLWDDTPYDHIHLMDNFGLANKKILQSSRVPVSVSAMSYQGRSPAFLYHLYLKSSYDLSGLTVVTYNEVFRKRLIEIGIEPERLLTIPWGIHPDHGGLTPDSEKGLLKGRMGIGSQKPLILWSGYIQQIQRKDFFFALETARRFLADGLDAVFFFAFKPVSFEGKFSRLAAPEKSIMIGPTEEHEFRDLKRCCDVFFSPVLNRDCILAPPLTWIEMMNAGVPILTTPVPGVETVVIPGETGYMSWNEQELLAGLKAILAETSGMRHKCLSLVKDNFNIENAAAGYLNLFNREPSQEKKRFKARLRYMDTKVVDRYDRQRFGSTKGRFVNSLEKRLIERAIQFASFSAGAKILDLPCGTGRISLLLAEKGFDITGGDISPGMVEKSRENADQLGLSGRTSFRPLDAENMDCPDDSFDAVVSLRFLGHTPPEARIRILQEFRRVAKRYIIVAYYRKSSLQEMARRRSRKKAGTPWYPVRLKDVDAEFTKVGIRRLKTFSLFKGVSETFLAIGEKAANNSFLPRPGGHGGKDFPVK